MRACFLVCITLALCHLQLEGQAVTDPLPPATQLATREKAILAAGDAATPLPNDPGQELLPTAQPEPAPASGKPVTWQADRETWAGDVWTLYGVEEFHYRDYVLRADKVTYNQKTT